jgi:hypothetical protein
VKRHWTYIACAAVLALCLGGCISNPGIVKIAPDTYMIARQSVGGMLGNTAAMKVEVINEANAFAESQGKIAIPVSFSEGPGGEGRYPTFDYQFRLVDPADLAATSSGHPLKTGDLYVELTKLDDLRKRGLLTESEFEQQKQKLLQAK